MKDKDKELARKILNKRASDTINGLYHYDSLFELMQAYHEAKMKEVTDADIEAWANSKEKIIDEMPETLKLHITKKIECRIDGAKAFRDGEIKHNG